MTVAELIEKLRALPQDLPVEYYSYDDYQDYPVMYMAVEEVQHVTAADSGTEGPTATVPAVRLS